MHRRQFFMSAVAASLLHGEPAEPQTFVYKKAAGCEIEADVFNSKGGSRKPVAVWIHGGALIQGSRKLPPDSRVLRALLEAGFAVVSIGYRLAPETKLPDIIDDVRDAFRWIRGNASLLNIEPDRMAVCGASAGGYLTEMTGFAVKPGPKALVAFWGYGDIVGDWYSRPDPFYLRQPAVKKEEALASVGKAALAEPPAKHNRGKFYLYCRQNGLWPKEVSGHDPASEDRWFGPYCPVRNVTSAYPPIMLVHGTADTDVPYAQSELMAARLKQAGVKHQFITVPDGGHGIYNIPGAEQDRIYRDAAMFLKSHV